MRLMLTIAALALAAPTLAANMSVTAPITAFLDGFNKGDMKAASAPFAKGDVAIIDEFAPHYWTGPAALASWAADFGKYAAANGETDGKVVTGKPTRMEVEETAAYVIVPAHYTFKAKGVAMVEDGQMIFALKGKAKAWKIAAWTWSGPAPKPTK